MPFRRPTFEVIDGGSDREDDPFSLTDYIQLASLGKRSVVVRVDDADVQGEVVMRDGIAWWARDARGEGEPAFRRLLMHGGGFQGHVPARCRPLTAGAVPRNIHCSLESMMLETARQWDEDTRDLPSPAGETPAVRPPPSAPTRGVGTQAHFDAFFEDGVDALLRKDYAEALAAFSAAHELRPDNPLVLANLQRLRALGYDTSTGETK